MAVESVPCKLHPPHCPICDTDVNVSGSDQSLAGKVSSFATRKSLTLTWLVARTDLVSICIHDHQNGGSEQEPTKLVTKSSTGCLTSMTTMLAKQPLGCSLQVVQTPIHKQMSLVAVYSRKVRSWGMRPEVVSVDITQRICCCFPKPENQATHLAVSINGWAPNKMNIDDFPQKNVHVGSFWMVCGETSWIPGPW